MKTALKTLATGIIVAAAGVAFARLAGPKACKACKSHCTQSCRCCPGETEDEATEEPQQTV